VNNNGLNLIVPPHQFVSGARPATASGAPAYAFSIESFTYGWDTSLGMLENQFWNDTVGLGSINVPNFVALLAGL
jgi:hypothetical protein